MIKARSTGWEVMRSENGSLLQSAIPSRPVNFNHSAGEANGWITRAVVLQTYFADEDERLGVGNQRCITCDVRTYGRYQRHLPRVPVLQRSHGLFDHDVYIPRSASQDIDQGQLRTGAAADANQAPTGAHLIDGDHVLIGFLDNDSSQPVILPFVMPHPSSRYVPEASDGRVKRIRYNGVLLEWDADSNFKIDATEAANEVFAANGVEESASGTGGQITLVTTDGTNKTSIHLNEQAQLLLGSDPTTPSDEPIVLGNLWIDVMKQLIDAILALTVGTAVGNSTTPINFQTFLDLKADIEAKNQVSDFIFAKKEH